MKKRVVELFAGVGGFRVGFNSIKTFNDEGRAVEEGDWEFVWANQWEPGTKIQHAFIVYEQRFGKSDKHINEDIFQVDKSSIPDHEVLVGGFPCQDYSVARPLSGEQGIQGKKGVLWWEIYKTLKAKNPPFVLLENVDRLIKSPSKQRGRDFGIMLACFNELDYVVEWRVINAADYGFPQRRRRVFIFATKKNLKSSKKYLENNPIDIVKRYGLFANSFKVSEYIRSSHEILLKTNDLFDLSNSFSAKFLNSGIMIDGRIITVETLPILEKQTPLKIILDHSDKRKEYLVSSNIESWKYLKGGKKIERTSKDGFKYIYSEGPIAFPDNLDRPARTMLTSESTLNRSSHIIFDEELGSYRTLTPLEAERLNGFPDNWTETLSAKRRFFMMGNALVTGIIQRLSSVLKNEFDF